MKQKNKIGGFSAESWVIAAVIVSGMIALYVLAVGSLASEYDVADVVVNEEFSDNFDQFEDNTEIIGDMWNATSGDEGLSVLGTFDILFKSTFQIIELIFESVTLVGSQVFSFVEFFGIPSQVGFIFGTLLLAILSIIIVFRVINSINRRDL